MAFLCSRENAKSSLNLFPIFDNRWMIVFPKIEQSLKSLSILLVENSQVPTQSDDYE